MLAISNRLPFWRPAPRRSLGQNILHDPLSERGMTADERYAYTAMNYGIGLGVGAVLGTVLTSAGVKASKTTAFITTGLGLLMGSVGFSWMVNTSRTAELTMATSGVVTGIGGMQILKSYGK